MVATFTKWTLLENMVSSNFWPKLSTAVGIEVLLLYFFHVGWVKMTSDGRFGTGLDRTGQAQHEHICRTAGGTTEQGMCATEACISKSDLSCGCLWWCPHGHVQSYGTWPLSGPSVWPFLFAGSLHSWPVEPTSFPQVPNPQPGSPPGTEHPPFPCLSGTKASGIHS